MKKLNFKNISYDVILLTSSLLRHPNNIAGLSILGPSLSRCLATPVATITVYV